MRVLAALEAVLSGTSAEGRGLLRWEPALLSAFAAMLIAGVSSLMGFNILAAVFSWVALPFLILTVAGISAGISAHLKRAPRA